MGLDNDAVKRYERVMANRSMEIGSSFEVRHKCENGHTFTLSMHEYYYVADKANKMYAHILIIPCCPKCESRNVEKLETPQEALRRHREEHREERKAELEQQQKMLMPTDEDDDNIPDDDVSEPEEIVEEPVKPKKRVPKPKKDEAAVCQEKGSPKKKKGKKQ